jgi:hypothetical protein
MLAVKRSRGSLDGNDAIEVIPSDVEESASSVHQAKRPRLEPVFGPDAAAQPQMDNATGEPINIIVSNSDTNKTLLTSSKAQGAFTRLPKFLSERATTAASRPTCPSRNRRTAKKPTNARHENGGDQPHNARLVSVSVCVRTCTSSSSSEELRYGLNIQQRHGEPTAKSSLPAPSEHRKSPNKQ